MQKTYKQTTVEQVTAFLDEYGSVEVVTLRGKFTPKRTQ